MSWLPKIAILGATLCHSEGEAEGATLHIRLGRFVVEVTFAAFAPGQR